MTSIGFSLLVLFFAFYTVTGPTNPFRYDWRDYVGSALLYPGLVLISVGLSVWLWRHMP